VETDRRIIDIALDYQFNSPETYSRAFKRMVGLQPYQWRRNRIVDQRRLLSAITPAHLARMDRGDYLRPALEETGPLVLWGLMALVQGDPAVIPQLWELLDRELGGQALVAGPRYGVAYYPRDTAPERGYLYLAAVEAAALSGPPGPGLVSKTMPPQRWARFTHKGRYAELPLTQDYIYQTWIPRSGQLLAGPWEVERYEAGWTGDDEAELALLIPV
jgi:AraC family transcriptional regulator